MAYICLLSIDAEFQLAKSKIVYTSSYIVHWQNSLEEASKLYSTNQSYNHCLFLAEEKIAVIICHILETFCSELVSFHVFCKQGRI